MENLIGKKQNVSKFKNTPHFSMFKRTDSQNKTIITMHHKADKLGKDSPGVGIYNSGIKQTKLTKRNVSIGCAPFNK